MATMCSICSGWSGQGMICASCEDILEKRDLQSRVRKLEEEKKQLLSELNERKESKRNS